MKACKDKKKFGGNSLIRKNHQCKKFGVCDSLEHRKYVRKLKKHICHKLLKHIPLTDSEQEYCNYYSIYVGFE